MAYASMKGEELKQELRDRNISPNGKNEIMVNKLELDDRIKQFRQGDEPLDDVKIEDLEAYKEKGLKKIAEEFNRGSKIINVSGGKVIFMQRIFNYINNLEQPKTQKTKVDNREKVMEFIKENFSKSDIKTYKDVTKTAKLAEFLEKQEELLKESNNSFVNQCASIIKMIGDESLSLISDDDTEAATKILISDVNKLIII